MQKVLSLIKILVLLLINIVYFANFAKAQIADNDIKVGSSVIPGVSIRISQTCVDTTETCPSDRFEADLSCRKSLESPEITECSYALPNKIRPDKVTQIIIISNGNIFISDNLLYENLEKDAISFIAANHESAHTAEASGNVTFGEPGFGNTFKFTGFLYTENNFESTNEKSNLQSF